MVDVSGKASTVREATAEAEVGMSTDAYQAAVSGNLPKGDLVSVVRLAGVMGGKRTSDLIPFCHPLTLTHMSVEADLDPGIPGLRVRATVRCTGPTGVEMEALTACAVACLAAIDMVKAADPWVEIRSLHVLAKSGGRSGSRVRPSDQDDPRA